MQNYLKTCLKSVPGARELYRFGTGRPIRTARERLLQKMPKRSVCAEIGVHEGNFSEQILEWVKPSRLHLIDPWEFAKGDEYKQAWYGTGGAEGQAAMDRRFKFVQDRFSVNISKGQLVVHRSYSSKAVDEFPDNYFDWIYIDGNHLYEFVKKDLTLFHQKVKPQGYIAGDDYGVTGWWFNGVQKAVDEFIAAIQPRASLEVIANQFIIKLA